MDSIVNFDVKASDALELHAASSNSERVRAPMRLIVTPHKFNLLVLLILTAHPIWSKVVLVFVIRHGLGGGGGAEGGGGGEDGGGGGCADAPRGTRGGDDGGAGGEG